MFFNFFKPRSSPDRSIDALQTRLDNIKAVLADLQQIATDLELEKSDAVDEQVELKARNAAELLPNDQADDAVSEVYYARVAGKEVASGPPAQIDPEFASNDTDARCFPTASMQNEAANIASDKAVVFQDGVVSSAKNSSPRSEDAMHTAAAVGATSPGNRTPLALPRSAGDIDVIACSPSSTSLVQNRKTSADDLPQDAGVSSTACRGAPRTEERVALPMPSKSEGSSAGEAPHRCEKTEADRMQTGATEVQTATSVLATSLSTSEEGETGPPQAKLRLLSAMTSLSSSSSNRNKKHSAVVLPNSTSNRDIASLPSPETDTATPSQSCNTTNSTTANASPDSTTSTTSTPASPKGGSKLQSPKSPQFKSSGPAVPPCPAAKKNAGAAVPPPPPPTSGPPSRPPPPPPPPASGAPAGPPPPPPPPPGLVVKVAQATAPPPPPGAAVEAAAEGEGTGMSHGDVEQKLDALYKIVTRTLSLVQAGGGSGGGGGGAPTPATEWKGRTGKPAPPPDKNVQAVHDQRELMLRELREKVEGRRKQLDDQPA